MLLHLEDKDVEADALNHVGKSVVPTQMKSVTRSTAELGTRHSKIRVCVLHLHVLLFLETSQDMKGPFGM